MAKSDDWWRCLKRLVGGPAACALDEHGSEEQLNALLLRHGLAVQDMDVGKDIRRRLVVPARSDLVDELFAGTPWDGGRYWEVIRAGPGDVVLKARSGIQATIGNTVHSVLLVDLAGWRAWLNGHRPAADPDAAGQELAEFVRRVEEVETEMETLRTDRAEIFKEANGRGYDIKALKAVVRRRKMDPDDRRTHDELVALYEDAAGEALGDTGDDDGPP